METFYNYFAKTFNYKYEIVPCFKLLNKIFSFVEFKNEFGEYVYKILIYDPEDMRFTDDICFSSPYQLNEFEVIRKLCITKHIEIDEAPQVYKNAKEIENLISETVQVQKHLKVIANYKGF